MVAGTKLTSNGDKLARRTNAVESGPMLVMVIVVSSGPAAPFEVLQMGGAGVNANSNWDSNCDSRASDGSSSFAC